MQCNGSSGSGGLSGVAAEIAICLCLLAIGCSSEHSELPSISSTQQPVIQGFPVIDPSAIGLVKIVLSDRTLGVECDHGSGVMLTNSQVLTAAHVLVEGLARASADCPDLPDTVTVILPGPDGQPVQSREFSAGIVFNSFQYDTRFPERDTQGADVGVFPITLPVLSGDSGPFTINGSDTGYRRFLSADQTPLHWGLTATCYGYGVSKVTAQPPANPLIETGEPHEADFTVLPFPAFDPPRGEDRCPSSGCGCNSVNQHPACHRGMFSVVLGGGSVPSDLYGEDILPFSGDSGGPCIGPDGTIWGIVEGGISNLPFGVRETYITSSDPIRGMGKFVSTQLAHLGIQLSGNLDGVGGDDLLSLMVTGGTFGLHASLDGGSSTFDTTLPVFGTVGGIDIPLAADINIGDFNDDSLVDVLAVVGGVPFYFEGGAGFDFQSAQKINYVDWQPPSLVELASNPFLYFTIADYNGDGVDDAEGLRRDGSVTYFLGSPSGGLSDALDANGARGTLQGLDVDYDGVEDVAIGAIGSSNCQFDPDQLECTGYDDVPGAVHIITGDASLADMTILESDLADFYASLTDVDVEPGAENEFGSALAWGAFDGFGGWLVIGAPQTRVNGSRFRGNAVIGFFDEFGEYIPLFAFPNDNPTSKYLGAALAAGDFDGDAFDDLVLTAPGPPGRLDEADERYSGDTVAVFFGGELFSGTSDEMFTRTQLLDPQSDFGESNYGEEAAPHPYRRFGASLAVGDYNCDGYDDLAIGVPGAEVGGHERAGKVVVTYGSSEGLRTDELGTVKFDQSMEGLADDAGVGDHFGWSLAAGNFNGDWQDGTPCADLVIGAPLEDGGDSGDSGRITVVYGGPGGLSSEGVQNFDRSLADVPGEPQATDRFGQTLSVTRLTADGFDDLMVGAPGEDLGVGAVFLFEGGPSGLVASSKVLRPGATVDGVEIPGTPDAIVVESTDAGPYLGIGQGDYFGGGFADQLSTALGGTSNGLLVVGSPYEIRNDNLIEWSGSATLVSAQPTGDLQLAVQRFEGDFEIETRERAQFGFAVTQPRPVRAPAPAPAGFDSTGYLSGDGGEPLSSILPYGGFEGILEWLPLGVTTSLDTALFTEGSASLHVAGAGFLTSLPFNPAALQEVGRSIRFDVYVPEASGLTGSVELKLNVPSQGLFSSLGTVDLSGAPQGRWFTVSFPLSDNVRRALFEFDLLATFKFVVTLPGGRSIRLDQLRFGGHLLSAPAEGCHLSVFEETDYFACTHDLVFDEARAACESSEMDLAAIESQEEDAFLTPLLEETSFIGARDLGRNGTWTWLEPGTTFWSGGVFGSAVGGAYSNWGFLQPASGLFNDHHCAAKGTLFSFGKWESRKCFSPRGYVCEQRRRH